MKPIQILCLIAFILTLNSTPVYADETKYDYQTGPLKITLDNKQNLLDLPAGYSYLNKKETKRVFEEWKEPYDGSEIGMVFDDKSQCLAILTFEETGLIKDDDADKLDADELLEDYRRGTEAANKQRKEQGVPELEVVGWDSPPRYDKIHHVLQWAIRGREQGSQEFILNHNAILLGRSGKLCCTVIGDQNQTAQLDAMRTLLSSSIQYTSGNDYLCWKKGDKVSNMTLAGLVTGGAVTAAYAAGKAGLLSKLVAILLGLKKGLVLIIVAIAAFFKKIWNKTTGQHEETKDIT